MSYSLERGYGPMFYRRPRRDENDPDIARLCEDMGRAPRPHLLEFGVEHLVTDDALAEAMWAASNAEWDASVAAADGADD